MRLYTSEFDVAFCKKNYVIMEQLFRDTNKDRK